jgi:hypothetical protein
MDVARSELVEADLGRLISKRASSDLAEDPDMREERWKASVRAYNRYLERRPEKADLAARLLEAQESEERVKNATGWARAYPIRRPPELKNGRVRPSA